MVPIVELRQYAFFGPGSIAQSVNLSLRLGIGLGLVTALPAGCIPSTPKGFDSPDPTSRLIAITDAASSNDTAAIPELIEQLESNDPAARMLAIRALESLTGTTLGYDHASPWWERTAAVRRWEQWAVENAPVPIDD